MLIHGVPMMWCGRLCRGQRAVRGRFDGCACLRGRRMALPMTGLVWPWPLREQFGLDEAHKKRKIVVIFGEKRARAPSIGALQSVPIYNPINPSGMRKS